MHEESIEQPRGAHAVAPDVRRQIATTWIPTLTKVAPERTALASDNGQVFGYSFGPLGNYLVVTGIQPVGAGGYADLEFVIRGQIVGSSANVESHGYRLPEGTPQHLEAFIRETVQCAGGLTLLATEEALRVALEIPALTDVQLEHAANKEFKLDITYMTATYGQKSVIIILASEKANLTCFHGR